MSEELAPGVGRLTGTDEEMAALWRKMMWFVLIAAIPGWLVYVSMDSENALALAGFVARLAVLNAIVSIPVALVLWIPLPKDAPENVFRGTLLILLCAFLSVSSGSVAHFLIKHAYPNNYGSSGMRIVWWVAIFLVARTPFTFRHRIKAVELPEKLNNLIRFISFSCLITATCWPEMAIPFLKTPGLRQVLVWVAGG